MAKIEDQLRNVRTLEDIVNILSILFNNMNSISRNYYDIFLNPNQMYVTVKMYDDDGVLRDFEIPNVATFKSSVLFSVGSPDEVLPANVGAFCIDTSTNDLYYKASGGSSASGWKKIYSSNTDSFLTPDGDAHDLKNLNMDNADRGVLSVLYGGTGISNLFSGLVKANGENPFTEAKENEDYVSPASMVGVVSFYAGDVNIDPNEATIVNKGWLVCNGKYVKKADYQNLYRVIGDQYGVDGDSFALPDLMDRYVKGGSQVNVEGDAVVGEHTHSLMGRTGEDTHTHGPGSYDITGVAGTSWMSKSSLQNPPYQFKGCFFKIQSGTEYKWDTTKKIVTNSNAKYYGVNDDSTSKNDPGMGFQASKSWTGRTGEDTHSHSLDNVTTDKNIPDPKHPEITENDVRHLTMVPIIKF